MRPPAGAPPAGVLRRARRRPAWLGLDGDDRFPHARAPPPLLPQAAGGQGAGRARRPVAVGPVDGLQLLVVAEHPGVRCPSGLWRVNDGLVVGPGLRRGDGHPFGRSGREVPVQAGAGDPGLGDDLGDGMAGVAQVRGVGELVRVDQDGPADPAVFGGRHGAGVRGPLQGVGAFHLREQGEQC